MVLNPCLLSRVREKIPITYMRKCYTHKQLFVNPIPFYCTDEEVVKLLIKK